MVLLSNEGLKSPAFSFPTGDRWTREVQEILHDANMAPLLPPIGSEIFKRFTPASLEEIQRRHEAEEKECQIRKENNIEVYNILTDQLRISNQDSENI